VQKFTFIWTSLVFCLSLFVISGILELNECHAREVGYKLTKQWETAGGLKVPESILYDESRNILFVSNICGNPTEKNNRGFISKVSLDGKIVALKWATGLNAPKGSDIYENTFYVSDIDHLVAIDLKTGKILNRYPAAKSKFLNDVAADSSGNVYITDSSPENSVIYKLSQGKMSVWMKGSEISRPNGLSIEKGRLIVGNSGDGSLKAINLVSKKTTTLAKVGSEIDGLRPDGKGNFFISDWHGKTSLVQASDKVDLLLDTTVSKINSADLEYVKSKNLLLIPTFFDNKVVAYRAEER